MNRFGICLASVAAAFASSISPAMASEMMAASSAGQTHVGYAGTAFGSPSAYGLGWGDVGAGFYLQTQNGAGNNNETDGSAALTIGLGDADRYLAMEVTASFSSLTGSRGSSATFGEVGAASFKLSRNLAPGTAVAFGALAATSWGFTKDLEQPTYYLAATHVFPLHSFIGPRPLVVTLGLASSGYEDTAATHSASTRPFGSVAFYVNRQVSLVADYSGRFLNAGVSLAPFAEYPIAVTLGAVNLNDSENLGTQFGLSISAAFKAF